MVTEPLTSLDLSFLCMEGRHTPMHLGALLLFATPEGEASGGYPDRLASVLRSRAAAVPRLRRRLTSLMFPPGAAAWTDDLLFDAGNHVHTQTLPGLGDRAELATLAAELLACPLDRTRPLWEMHVIDGLAEGGVAVLVKVHHALADGLRAVRLGMAIFDNLRAPTASAPLDTTDTSPDAGVVAGLLSTASGLVQTGRKLIDPRTSPEVLQHRARQARAATSIATSVTQHLLRPAPPSPLNVTIGPRRRFAMLRLDLDDIRSVRRRHGGTVNDVVLAAVAGGLRSWLAARGDVVRGPMRALVPVSRPHDDTADTTGNRLSGYLIELPVEEPDPLTRLRALRDAMEANKAAGAGHGPGAFPTLANLVPAILLRLAGPFAATTSSRLFNTVITQVPLPNLALTLAGARLTEIYPVVPLAEGQALGVAVTTYARTAHLGLYSDHRALPDLEDLAPNIAHALAELITA